MGDFSSAGGTLINTFNRMPNNQAKLGVGENGFLRLMAMGSADARDMYLSGALEAQSYDGPWTDINEDAQKINALLKLGRENATSHWGVSAMYYDNEWNSADQIPARAVSQGLIDELVLDLAANRPRQSLGPSAARKTRDHFDAFSFDPVEGDQFDSWTMLGVWLAGERAVRSDGVCSELECSTTGDLFSVSRRYRFDDGEPVGKDVCCSERFHVPPAPRHDVRPVSGGPVDPLVKSASWVKTSGYKTDLRWQYLSLTRILFVGAYGAPAARWGLSSKLLVNHARRGFRPTQNSIPTHSRVTRFQGPYPLWPQRR